jgi:hypothetical protein
MASDGTFEALLGATWNNVMSAFSTRMGFADQRLRYLFLSTCNSVRVMHGHDPIRTWSAANLGARMIFGFESTSLVQPGVAGRESGTVAQPGGVLGLVRRYRGGSAEHPLERAKVLSRQGGRREPLRGWCCRRDGGYLVARREVTVTADGFTKRHRVEVPL